jgi:hypothetical protein
MSCFGDVPIGEGFMALGRMWLKVDERHAADVETNETQLFWDVASASPLPEKADETPKAKGKSAGRK